MREQRHGGGHDLAPAYAGLVLHQTLEAGEEGGEDVELQHLQPRGLGSLDAVGEVCQHLQAVFVRGAREDAAEHRDTQVYDRHAQRRRRRGSGLGRQLGTVQPTVIVLQRVGPSCKI